MRSNTKRDVLHIAAAHIFSVLFCRKPNGLFKKADSLVVATSAHRVDDDDV